MRRILLAAISAYALSSSAQATWSVVVFDRATREIVVASATCVPGDLKTIVPAIVVGRGAAATQSIPGPNDLETMGLGFRRGWTGSQILARLQRGAGSQYGIVGETGAPVTFTGAQTLNASLGVAGEMGSVAYAIQGNRLTGDPVVLAAEAALRLTPGDLGQRVMAAMEVAHRYGGDGGCSCRGGEEATDCGAPPQGSFAKTALSGFLMIARIGDRDGRCTSGIGCANGEYYYDYNLLGSGQAPDPVPAMRAAFDQWRAGMADRPDHIQSTTKFSTEHLPPDGVSVAWARVQLRDLHGAALTHGRSRVQVRALEGPGRLVAIPGEVRYLGHGAYAFPVRAGTAAGIQKFEIVADDGVARATLFPYPELAVGLGNSGSSVQPVPIR